MADVTITFKGVDDLTGAIKGASGALGGMADIAGGALAVAIGGVLTPVIDGAIGAMGDFFGSALEAEQGQARLAQVIKSTGGAAGLTQDAANDLAQQFMNLAGGSDDAILAIEEMGLRMGTISAEEMPAFIQSSLDLGAVMGDNATAARVLAQAQEDPIGVLGRLRKAGILFTEDQEKAIKAMVDSGDAAGATALVMERLAEATGGAAAANAETLAGKWEVFKGQLSEAGESIGTAVLPVFTQLFDGVIAPAIPMITSIASAFAGFIQTFVESGLEDPIGNLANLFWELSTAFGASKDEATNVFNNVIALRGPFEELLPMFQPVIDAALNLAGTFAASMPMIMTSVQGMVDFVIGLFNTFSPTIIANITTTLTTISAFWTAHGAEVMAVVSFLFNTLATVIGGALTLISGIISATLTLVTGIWTAASALLQGDTATAWATIQATIATALQIILATLTTILASALSITDTSLASFIASWTGTFALAQTIIETFFANLIASWTGTFALAASILQAFFANLLASWTGTFSLALSIFQGFVANTIASVAGFALSIIAQFNNIVGSIINAFKIDWGAVGSGIIDGIRQGVMNAAGGLGQAAADAANWALQQAKNALGISSPSKAFMGVGANMMAGMALGIGQNARLPAAAMAGATSNISSVANINIDARGAQRGVGREVERATTRALKRAGQQADARLRMRGAM